MSMSNKTFALLACGLVLGACLGEETGISQRHIHGIVTLPPVGLFEAELTPRSDDDADNNDSDATADGPFSIAYGYHIVRGSSDKLCDPMEIEAGAVPDCDVPLGQDPDVDFYRISAGYQGPFVIKARLAEEIDQGDVDITVYEGVTVQTNDAGEATNELYVDGNLTNQVIDDDGNPVFDDEDNPVLEFVLPRYSTQVEDGDEFLVAVTVSGDAGSGAYELVFVGNDPREHNIEFGIEGDVATFPVGESDDPLIEDNLAILVGAFLSNDIDNLGDPVAGTSCEDWTLDDETETFWCAYDMVFAHQVSIESGVLIDGMGDGKDNDCDGVADDGTGTADADGDGFTVADGDCNDTDPDVGPFRGDVAGDRKDNDCDGWADNGPDDVDNDGDGYCENAGYDVNGDGVCRGPQEVGGLGTPDCNDANADIFPGLDHEHPSNGLDDDCAGGDGALDFGNTDGDETVYDANDIHAWSDIEEIACGTDEQDPTDMPVDEDRDGLCDSDCLGQAGCAQDNDADGEHNWTEIICGSDPEDAESVPGDLDGDEICDGQDIDADNDGFVVLDDNGGDDCNDLDPNIHPHLTDDVGNVVEFNYDVPNGVNDDCDDFIDENNDWTRNEDGTYSQNDDYQSVDQDGDGYTLGLRDCDDTDPEMRLGNYETRSTNVVSSDFTTVNIFAGDVASLNNTLATANSRRVTELIPYDLAKDRVAWELADQWETFDNPPLLQPGGVPISEAWFSKQPELGNIWFEAEPNDIDIAGFSPAYATPWPDGTFQELGESAGAGKTNELYGEIGSIEPDSWAGDNDAFHVTFPEAGFITASLDWDAGGSDYDTVFICYFFNAFNPEGYYSIPFEPGLTDLSKPEEGTTIVPLPDGADCWIFVVGYSGGTGGYKLEITPQGN